MKIPLVSVKKISVSFPIMENNHLPLFCSLQASRSFMTLIYSLPAEQLVQVVLSEEKYFLERNEVSS